MEVMQIAQQKRKENIAEYILYMFQVEDLIRAFNLDIELIKSQVISAYKVDDSTMSEIVGWYNNLLVMMEKEKIREKGHLQFLKNQINDLNEFHLKLFQDEINAEYSTMYRSLLGLVNEFRQKSNPGGNDIETCLSAIYGYLLLKLQKKEISEGTLEAVKGFGQLLGFLSKLFFDFEKGDLKLELN